MSMCDILINAVICDNSRYLGHRNNPNDDDDDADDE